MTGFKLRSEITNVEVIASGRKLRIMGLLRKLYGKGRWRKLKGRALVVLDDPAAEAQALLRVIDESGEDYLFPADLFVPIELPVKARPAFSRATSASGASRPARRSTSMNQATPAGRTRGITWQQLCAHAASLPGVEQGVCYGTPALYVRKRFLARLKEDRETVAIKVDFADRDVLLEADPRAFYVTDHYRPYPAVLMRLGHVRQGVAVELLEQAWRRAAPQRLVLAHLSSRHSANRS